jgi:hypothetical protein
LAPPYAPPDMRLEIDDRAAAALRAAAADVVMSERVAGHDDAMWREEFPLMVIISIIYPCNFGCPNCPYTEGNSDIRLKYADAPFVDPALFKNWVLGSPTLAWDDNWIFRREAEYARTHKDLPAHLYIWSGEQDGNTAAALRLAELLRSRKYPNLAVTTETIVDGTHDSIWPDSLFRALRAIYLDSKTQEVRTYIDVVVPNASLNAVADQVKACLLADHIPIADSSTDSLVMSDPIVSKSPRPKMPW